MKVLKKKLLYFLGSLGLVAMLASCGSSEDSNVAEELAANPKNFTAEDFTPISDGLKDYKVWYTTDIYPTRESIVGSIIVTDKDELTYYKLPNSEELSIEQVTSMSDDEVVDYAESVMNRQFEEMLTSSIVYDVEKHNADLEDFGIVNVRKNMEENPSQADNQQFLDYYESLKPMTDNIYYQVSGDNKIKKGKYGLDITLDDLGDSTRSLELHIKEGIPSLTGMNGSQGALTEYSFFMYSNIDVIRLKWEDPERYESLKQDHLNVLNELGHFERVSGYEENHPQTYVPDVSLTWEYEDVDITLTPASVRQEIFDQTFAGVGLGENRALITKVKDDFVGFTLDSTERKSKNVTIEGK